MRRALVILCVIFGLAAPAIAQPAAPTPGPAPAAEPAPNSKMRQPEQLPYKPSGFRIPGVPAKGGAYRYKLLIPGAFCVLLTAGLVIRYLRRVNRSRATPG